MKGIRIVAPWAMVAILTVAAISLPGCTQVGDSITGVGTGANLQPSSCTDNCNRVFTQGAVAETKKLLTQLKQCASLPESQRQACINAAWAAYQAALQALDNQRKACIGSCHQQGAGSGG